MTYFFEVCDTNNKLDHVPIWGCVSENEEDAVKKIKRQVFNIEPERYKFIRTDSKKLLDDNLQGILV